MKPKHFTTAMTLGFLCSIISGHCTHLSPEQPNPLEAAQPLNGPSRITNTSGQSLAVCLEQASHQGPVKTFSFKYGGGTTVVESQGKKTVRTEINETNFQDKSSFNRSGSKQKSSFGLNAKHGKTKGSFNFTGGSRTTTSSESRDIQKRSYTEITSTTRKETTIETKQDETVEFEAQYYQPRHSIIRRPHNPQRAAYDLDD